MSPGVAARSSDRDARHRTLRQPGGAADNGPVRRASAPAVAAFAVLLLMLGACAESPDEPQDAAPPADSHSAAPLDDVAQPAREAAQELEQDPDRQSDAEADTSTASVSGTLEIHFLDVGQADATLLRHEEAVMLIDTGDWRRTDTLAYLEQLGIDRIDVVAITHPHADHIGQFDHIMAAVDVDEVWWPGTTTTTQTFERALSALEASPASYAEPRAGDRTTLGPLTIDIIGPEPGTRLSDIHDDSLSMRVSFGDVSALFTGDAERSAEATMVARYPEMLKADIYQAGHHGSDTSTTASMLAAVDPAVTVISSGVGNSYGHPHASVLARLAEHGGEVYATAANGTVVVTTDGADFTVTFEREGTVAAGGDGLGSPDPPAQTQRPPSDQSSAPSGNQSDESGCVNLNSASADELGEITHVGPSRARDIIALRPWPSVGSLDRVDGIGPARLQDIEEQGLACVT